jgi:hypothetical protein
MSTTTRRGKNDVATTTEPNLADARFERACTEDMAVTFTGPAIATVAHAGESYQVELESGACECPDFAYRGGDGTTCKHVQRACLSALYVGTEHSTELVARVARYARAAGCQHSVAGCNGPTTTSDRCGGLPCAGCCDAVRTADVDEMTVWNTLARSEVSR